MADEEPLALANRRRVFDFVREHPGTHMREIQRRLGMTAGTLEYHLHVLVREELLVERRQGRYVRYYVTAQVGRAEKEVLGLLRQEVPRRLCARLLLEPDQSHGELLRHFSLAPSTLSFHLKKLVQGGLVEARREGRETHFRVLDPDLVGKVLVDYRASFLDDLVDRFADVWLNLGGGLDAPAPQAGAEKEQGMPPAAPAPPAEGAGEPTPPVARRQGGGAPGGDAEDPKAPG